MNRQIENISSELNDDYSNFDLYNIDSWGADLSFRELVDMYQNDELLKPELQRKYVWDKSEASRFIESLLLGLPVPSIFLAKTEDEKMLIVDGYQRIMTVNDYIKGVFSSDNKNFRLSNSKKINEIWRNKSFIELSQVEQRRIKSTTIHAIIFRQKEPTNDDTSLYQIFERINTTGRILTSQEIRNCVYQGAFNTFLTNLNKDKRWRILFGSKQEESRMRDVELILRFFALSDQVINTLTVTSISLKEYLNKFMKTINSHNNFNDLREKFDGMLDFVLNNFGEDAFCNIDDSNKPLNKIHPTIFDSIAIATSLFLSQNSNNHRIPNDLKEKRLALLHDEQYKNFISIRTTNLDSIRGRISRAKTILYAIH